MEAGGLLSPRFCFASVSEFYWRALPHMAGIEHSPPRPPDGLHHPASENRWEMVDFDAQASRGTKK